MTKQTDHRRFLTALIDSPGPMVIDEKWTEIADKNAGGWVSRKTLGHTRELDPTVVVDCKLCINRSSCN